MGILEAIGDALADLLLTKIFYWPGWLFLRILTLGHYPPSQDIPHNKDWVALVGLLGCMLPLIIYAIT